MGIVEEMRLQAVGSPSCRGALSLGVWRRCEARWAPPVFGDGALVTEPGRGGAEAEGLPGCSCKVWVGLVEVRPGAARKARPWEHEADAPGAVAGAGDREMRRLKRSWGCHHQ